MAFTGIIIKEQNSSNKLLTMIVFFLVPTLREVKCNRELRSIFFFKKKQKRTIIYSTSQNVSLMLCQGSTELVYMVGD